MSTVKELEAQLYKARLAENKANDEAMFNSAQDRCNELVKQMYWEKEYLVDNKYASTGFLNVYKVVELKPEWWSTLCGDGMGNAYTTRDGTSLMLSGHVEHLMLPALPTFVRTKEVHPQARGMCADMPQHISFKVRPVTKKQSVGCVPCWFEYENTLVVPFTVTAAPILGFRESPTYFDGFVPSTPERYQKAVSLILEFVSKTQEMFQEIT